MQHTISVLYIFLDTMQFINTRTTKLWYAGIMIHLWQDTKKYEKICAVAILDLMKSYCMGSSATICLPYFIAIFQLLVVLLYEFIYQLYGIIFLLYGSKPIAHWNIVQLRVKLIFHRITFQDDFLWNITSAFNCI